MLLKNNLNFETNIPVIPFLDDEIVSPVNLTPY